MTSGIFMLFVFTYLVSWLCGCLLSIIAQIDSIYNYGPKKKFAKVMFSQVSDCPRGWGQTPPGRHPPPSRILRIQSTIGRHASYWNAVLFITAHINVRYPTEHDTNHVTKAYWGNFWIWIDLCALKIYHRQAQSCAFVSWIIFAAPWVVDPGLDFMTRMKTTRLFGWTGIPYQMMTKTGKTVRFDPLFFPIKTLCWGIQQLEIDIKSLLTVCRTVKLILCGICVPGIIRSKIVSYFEELAGLITKTSSISVEYKPPACGEYGL